MKDKISNQQLDRLIIKVLSEPPMKVEEAEIEAGWKKLSRQISAWERTKQTLLQKEAKKNNK